MWIALSGAAGGYYQKLQFRQILIPVFLVAALSRTFTYTMLGMYSAETIKLLLFALPGLFAGLWLGNRLFFKLSERLFSHLIGVLLLVIGVYTIVKDA